MATDANVCTELWQSIIVSTISSMFCLLVLIMVYGKLCNKIEKHSCNHTARRQPGLRTKKPESALAGEEFGSEKMPDSQQVFVSQWLSKQTQGQQVPEPNVQIKNCMTGSRSGGSHNSLTRRNSGPEDINYTTIVFEDPMLGTSSKGGYEELNVKDHYENVSLQERKVDS